MPYASEFSIVQQAEEIDQHVFPFSRLNLQGAFVAEEKILGPSQNLKFMSFDVDF